MSDEQVEVVRVAVVESGKRASRGWLACEEGASVSFSTEKFETYFLGRWEPVVYDAFLLAAAVEFCDLVKKRSAYDWERQFELQIPVHEPARWKSADVSTALHGALEFLTGDRWQISFSKRSRAIEAPAQSHFPMPTGEVHVLPYSDGLDSHAVAGLMEKQYGDNLVRVRLGSKSINHPGKLERKRPFASVPYKVRSDYGRKESSARSRGFKFAMLSGMAAYLIGSKTVFMPESGQGALGSSLVPVGQAYEDYRNHPAFTGRMERFFDALLNHKVQFEFPRLWSTKGETLRDFIAQTRDTSGWKKTWSCWQGSRQVSVDGAKRQCGICAACMLRRLSVHAAGLREDKDTYVWDDLRSADFEKAAVEDFPKKKRTEAQYQYAIAGTLHLDHLAALADSDVHRDALQSKAYQIGRALGRSEEDTFADLQGLLRRHAKEWKSFTTSLGSKSFIMHWAEAA